MSKSSLRRRGFIMLFGTRNIVSGSSNDEQPIDTRCPRCGAASAMIGKTVRPWFTLFLLPLFPVGAARTFTQCTNCQASFAVAPQQLANQAARVDAKQNERAIAMYNSLRASPGNSITLNDVMQLYASLGEYDQAISAAADFPQALNNSEQCMATLGRVYLAKNEHAAAIKWFEAAIARNPSQGEAQYYKAAAYLTATPPEPQKAVPAARAARNAGYPNADELLREAEEKVRGAA
ncbi:MAG TPA: zinc-ribbon domain-containing protein [Tepidisphaeraceae bacterium]|nr:zinc-ribbon domain-containing protein [Tepidisphaeraceae bacterium]